MGVGACCPCGPQELAACIHRIHAAILKGLPHLLIGLLPCSQPLTEASRFLIHGMGCIASREMCKRSGGRHKRLGLRFQQISQGAKEAFELLGRSVEELHMGSGYDAGSIWRVIRERLLTKDVTLMEAPKLLFQIFAHHADLTFTRNHTKECVLGCATLPNDQRTWTVTACLYDISKLCNLLLTHRLYQLDAAKQLAARHIMLHDLFPPEIGKGTKVTLKLFACNVEELHTGGGYDAGSIWRVVH
mmetsp:Transcript_93615/g.165018  ORF Transcript_93615/g.165018 Transcript_93615/m.165018 type:complete len:245 (+) Transcript_93615:36-770(+)